MRLADHFGRRLKEGNSANVVGSRQRFRNDNQVSDVASWPIVLKKSSWGDDQNFSGLLMRFARGDMRDHIVSHKNDHGASYECYGVLQWRSLLKISFCEIFSVVQFSTFATLSAHQRSGDTLTEVSLVGVADEISPFDPGCVKTRKIKTPLELHSLALSLS